MRSKNRVVGGKVVAAVDAAAMTQAAGAKAPAKSASRADWDAYAAGLGLDPAEFGSKDDLIAAAEKGE